MDFNKGVGDPDGKRLARRQSFALEEACRLAECLARMLRQCNLPDKDANAIATDLRVKSVQAAERAEGRIESRLTTKKTGHPLLEGRKVNCLFLDESGTSVIHAPEKVFALGGVAIHEEDIAPYQVAADKIKQKFFGRTDITFHEPLMRNHRDSFSFHGDPTRRREFDDEIRNLVANTPFVVFGIGIRKDFLKREYIDSGSDPYLPTQVYDLAIMLLLERYTDFLATHTERRIGRVHLESIGAREDAEHQAAYADLLLHGTQFVSEKAFQSWVEAGCRFVPKSGSNPAELADLVAREVFEWTRDACQVEPPYWQTLASKIHLRAEGHYGKFGIKLFPSTGIEDAIMAHRQACGAGKRN
jgi:hypothetical protein